MKDRIDCIVIGFDFIKLIDDVEPIFVDLELKDISPKEFLFIWQKILKTKDVILYNTNKPVKSIYVTNLLQFAYTNLTPIFGVGGTTENKFLKDITLCTFNTVEEAIDHYKAHYR